ncbi:hypothetical protein [Thermococcus sp.]|uniref:hypothetical protein n=1 Tax=Thermococcus sp. TaxID=35749 RepID=UPI002621F0E9|nr:hypothetical protein [Thermococcus sp.]
MRFSFEGFDFELPAFTLLSGPMAAAKPLFAQKFIAEFLGENQDYKVLYFATSSPVCGVLRNLKVFGLGDDLAGGVTFLDYQPSCEGIRKVDTSYYIGNFSNPEQLEKALGVADERTIVVVPSFTLLLIGREAKDELTDVLIKGIRKANPIAFVAVNTAMFGEQNERLAESADNVLEFTKKGEKVFVRALKFKGAAPKEEVPFDFPREMFDGTKKEVAERTAQIIREKKVGG